MKGAGQFNAMFNLRSTFRSRWVIFVAMILLGSLTRLGYGVARYQSRLSFTGTTFMKLWDFDGLEHVLIAKALVEDGAYKVALVPGLEEKHIRTGRDALFKAPLYEAFLAAIFSVSGYSFALFFPLQALFGGLLSGLAALIALEAFRSYRVAYFAGIAAAIHPVLVNSASQPYNENLFFALLFASVWAFIAWVRTNGMTWALICGVLAGLAVLCRETAVPPFIVMVIFATCAARPRAVRMRAVCGMVIAAMLIIAPWTWRNYLREGALVPVAGASSTVLGIGNNECVAQDPLFSWYWAEGACRSLDMERARLRNEFPTLHQGSWVLEDRVYGRLGAQFVFHHPASYFVLCLRRLWTVLLPFHPKMELGTSQRLVMFAYWLLIIPAGLVGAITRLRKPQFLPMLSLSLIAVSLLPLILIYLSPDMRLRVGADLLFAGFAGSVWIGLLRPGSCQDGFEP